MKTFSLAILTCLSVLLTKCKSPSTEIKDAFDTVNKSIEKSNAVLDRSIKGLYSSIDTSRQLTPVFKIKADSIYHVTMDAYHFIDSVKHVMEIKDSTGDDLNVAENVFIKSKTGDIFATKLSSVYKCAYFTLSDDSKKPALDSVLSDMSEASSYNWKKKYFEGTPTVAAITILNKFKNDCTNAATISLSSIKEHLKN